jgi:hypothetical protein
MDDQEGDQLYAAAVAAYRMAQAAYEKTPRPRSPEWREWQMLPATAELVAARYFQHVESQHRPTLAPAELVSI